MAKEFSNEQKEIIRAQNDARLYLPDSRDDRLALILDYRRQKAKENDLIAQAKRDVGSNDTLKHLTDFRHLKKQAITFINVLADMEATARAACLRQVIGYGEDFGWIIPDLFDNGAIGQQPVEGKDTAAFDKTSEGKRRGGAAAQPRSTEQMAASNAAPTREIPSISLEEAEKRFEEAKAASPGRGRKPKEYNDAKDALDKARAAAASGEKPSDPAPTEPNPNGGNSPAGGGAEAEPERETVEAGSNVVSLVSAQRAANDETDREIREQSAKMAEGRKAPAEAEKAKRTRAKKGPPPAAAQPSAPPAPPEDIDDDAGDDHTTGLEAGPIGNAPSSYQIGNSSVPL